MALELHNFIWSEERLVQVETQPHHIAGVLAEVNQVMRENELDWGMFTLLTMNVRRMGRQPSMSQKRLRQAILVFGLIWFMNVQKERKRLSPMRILIPFDQP